MRFSASCGSNSSLIRINFLITDNDIIVIKLFMGMSNLMCLKHYWWFGANRCDQLEVFCGIINLSEIHLTALTC